MEKVADTPLTRELYYHYGVAAHCAQNLEKELSLLLYLPELGLLPDWDIKNVEETYYRLNKKTLGALLTKLNEHFKVESGFDLHLKESLNKRNYLAHHFFGDNAQKLLNQETVPPLIDELKGIATHLQKAVSVLRPFNEQIRKRASKSRGEQLGS